LRPRFAAQFDRVWKVYRRGLLGRRSTAALRGVTLDVASGSVLGLIGPNRAGKTTLAKTLLSICHATSGTIRRLGRPAEDRATLARVGYLHECEAFPRYLTAAELLLYYGSLSFVPSDELRKRIPRLLERVGLADRPRESIASFSKGMVQRLALAQALVNEPELLVLDEPTEGLDMSARRLLHDLILEHRQQGGTTILVSHSLTDIDALCDRVAVLRHGEVAFEGALEELTRNALRDTACPLAEALVPLYAESAP
jgi:ABC-2 type transport system ATP-binding protein